MNLIDKEKFFEAALQDTDTTKMMAKKFGLCQLAESVLDRITIGYVDKNISELDDPGETYAKIFTSSLNALMRYLFTLNKQVAFLKFVQKEQYYDVYLELSNLI